MRTKARAGAAGLAILAAACGSSEAAITATVAPAVQVDRHDPQLPLLRLHEAPALLIDRDNRDVVYLAEAELASGECRFYVSTDRARTWRPESAPALLPFTSNCAMGSATSQNIRHELQQGPDGTIYLVFQANDPGRGGSRSVMLGRSADRGRTWETVAIDPGKPTAEPGVLMEVNFEGHLAFDPDKPGHIYAMWRRSHNNKDRSLPPAPPTRPFMAESNDGGRTWSQPTMVVDKNSGFDGPRPIVVDGALWAFYRESAPSAAPGGPPPVTRLFAAVSTDGGKTFTDHEIANADDASEPVPVYDRKRREFYVVWHDNREKELDAYFSRSSDGKAWSKPARLNDDPRGTRVGQHYPMISMSPDGRIDVAWYDWRDDPFPAPVENREGRTLSLFSNRGVMASVYVTSSRDGGRTWSPNVRMNDVLIDRSIGTWKNNADVLAPVALASWNDAVVVAWSDTRNGNDQSQSQDIYTAVARFGDAADDEDVGAVQAGLAGGLLGLGVAMVLAFVVVRRQTGQPAAG